MIYLILSTAFFIGGIVIIYWLHNQYHLDNDVEPTPPPQNAPLISICIPARNEERNIRACVESALGQDYPNLEVIVLDDRSTDATPEILRRLSVLDNRLKIISGSDLPAGWAGKPHALYQASAAARPPVPGADLAPDVLGDRRAFPIGATSVPPRQRLRPTRDSRPGPRDTAHALAQSRIPSAIVKSS